MDSRIRKLILLIYSCQIVTSCRTFFKNSELKYGLTEKIVSVSKSSLVWLAPQATVKICGNARIVVSNAVEDWLEAVGRRRLSMIEVSETCEKSYPFNRYFAQINAVDVSSHRDFASDYELKFVEKYCDELKYKSVALNWPERIGGMLIFCEDPNRSRVLHEVGHLVGLCDQYSQDESGRVKDPVGMHKLCSSVYRSVVASRSVMNHAIAREPSMGLTDDDILAARVLACRSDVQKDNYNPNRVYATLLEIQDAMKTWSGVRQEINRIANLGGEFLQECRDHLPPS